MNKLISITYASSAVTLFSEDELITLLKQSRENNARQNISGLLLYQSGNFIQVLEGPEDAVKALYQKIQRDKRHHNVILLSQDVITKRQFADWEMGFQDIDKLARLEVEGFSRFLDENFSPQYLRENPTRATILLDAFKENMTLFGGGTL